MTAKSGKKLFRLSDWQRSLARLFHPLWLLSVVVLVVNDHVLKASSLWPQWLTGKLSDFAGMVVAPVLLVAVLGLRRKAPKALAMGTVALVFAAINVSPTAATLLRRACAWIGVSFHTVVDPSDLLGLLALPFAWYVMRGEAAAKSLPLRTLRFRQYLQPCLALVATAACLASGQPNPTWNTSGFLFNTTGAKQSIQVRLYQGQLQCEQLAVDAERLLAKEAFGKGITFELKAGDTLPLQLRALAEAGDWEQLDESPIEQRGCQLALLQAEGMSDVVVWWNDDDVPTVQVPLNANFDTLAGVSEPLGGGRVDLLIGNDGTPILISRGELQLTQLNKSAEPDTCGELGGRVQWSSTAFFGDSSWLLEEVKPTSEGCLDLSLSVVPEEGGAGGMGAGGMGAGGMGAGGMGAGGMGAGEATLEHWFVCLPAGAFPFSPSEILQIDEAPAGLGRALQLRSESETEVVVLTDQADTSAANVVAVTERVDCNGVRQECGALVVPHMLKVASLGDLLPTESMTLEPAGSRSRTLFLASAEETVAAPLQCSSGWDELALKMDLVLVYELEGSQ